MPRAGSSAFTLLPDAGPPRLHSRRQFLVSLGVLAGAALAAPALSRLVPRPPARRTIAREALGTWVRITVHDDDDARVERAVARAFRAIAVVDAQMSVHRADSELSRVNAAAGIAAVAVSAALREVVARSADVARASAGVVVPTVLPLMRLYGFYGSGRARLPRAAEVDATLAVTGADAIVLDAAAGTLGLTRRGAGLDLGASGKGWALDRAVEALRAEGVRSALVDVGRNVYGLGAPADDRDGWRVGVLHPLTRRVDRTFVLRDAAIATSGNAEQARVLDGVRIGHLLDAARGLPANPRASATVMARTGVASDLCASLAFLSGADAVRARPDVLATHEIG